MAQPLPRLVGDQQLLDQLRPFMQRKILQFSCQVTAVAGPARHGLMMAAQQACYTAMQQLLGYFNMPADSLTGVHVDYVPAPRPAREDRLDTLHMHLLMQPHAADMAMQFLLSGYVGGLALTIPGMQHPVLAQMQHGERQVYLARVQLEGLPLLPPGPILSMLQKFTAELGGVTVHWVGQWDPAGAIVNRVGPAGPLLPIFLPPGLLPPNLSSTTPIALLEGGTSRLARGPEAWSATLDFPDVAELRVALRRVPNRARHTPQALAAWTELAVPLVAGQVREPAPPGAETAAPAPPAAPAPLPPPAPLPALHPIADVEPPPGLDAAPLPPRHDSPPPLPAEIAPVPEEPAPPLPHLPPQPLPDPALHLPLAEPLLAAQAPPPPPQPQPPAAQPQPPPTPHIHPLPAQQPQPLRRLPQTQQPCAPADPVGVVKPRRTDRPIRKPVVDNTERTPPQVGSWVRLQHGPDTFYGLIIAHNQDVRRGTNIRITLPRVVWDSGEYTDDGRWDDPLHNLRVVTPAAVPDASVAAVVAYLNGTGCGDNIVEPLYDIVAFNISHRRVDDETTRLPAAPDQARTPAGLRRVWLQSRRAASAASSDYGGGAGSAEDDLNERAMYGSGEDPFVTPRRGRTRFTAPSPLSLSTAQHRTGRQPR